MNFSAQLIGSAAAGAGYLILIVLLVLAVLAAPWHALMASSARQNVVLGSWLALIALGAFHSNPLPGLPVHFLGIAAVTLIIGWPLALLGSALAVLGSAGLSHDGFSAVGFAFLAWGAVPIAITALVYRLTMRFLPPNYFIYLFVTVFFAAALGFVAAAFATVGLVVLLGVYPWPVLATSYLAVIPIQVVPEAMLNGMVMLGLTLLKPEWVHCFDADRYFKN